MWFWFSIIALLCWSGSDLFSKIGCREADDRTAHLKMVMAVGLVMGLHAFYEVFVGGVEISLQIILTYLPVSLLYILSMAMGYIGLRYIELSISSPICNSSGALVGVSAVTALWSASRGIYGMLTGLNAVYGVSENRGYIYTRSISVVYTFVFILILLLTLVLHVFGSAAVGGNCLSA